MNTKTVFKWFSLLLLMMVAGISGATAQSIAIDDFAIGAGATKDVAITLAAENPVYGIQTDIVLSEGLSVQSEASAVDGLNCVSNVVSTGAKRVSLLSLGGEAIPAGEVITLTVKAADSFTGGTIQLTNTRLTTTSTGTELKVDDVTVNVTLDETVEPTDPWENVKITPAARSEVESLQEFELDFSEFAEVQTFWGAGIDNPYIVITGTEDKVAEGTLGDVYDGKIPVTFAEPVTEPGSYTLIIPALCIQVDGQDNPELSFVYTVKSAEMAEFTIEPAPGEVESLSTFTITFNKYMVELDGNETAFLFNAETEEEVAAYVVEVGGKKLIVTLAEEVTAPGEYQLNVEGVKKMDGTFAPDMQFDYTIKSGETDTNYYILGDFFGWDNPKQLEPTDDGLYVLVCDATVEAKKYEYKLRQGDNWDGYQLPASGNYDFVFGTDEYPAGDYTLTFTANVGSEEINGIPAYTVVLTAVKKGTDVEPTDPWENVKITPAARSEVESLQEFELDFSEYAEVQTFWGAGIENPYIVVTGTETKVAEGTLGDVYDGKVSLTFAEPITEPGSYTLIIPALSIQVDGEDNPELSFLYTIKGEDAPDYTIDPEGVVQESLSVFNITFNNYGIEQYNYDAQATLKNETTGTELKADINVIGTNRVFLSFEETTEPGNYTLTIPAKTLANAMTGSPLDFEISASYRIEGAVAEDYTIDPAPGEVESLQSFTITFNNYMIELDGSENAYLFNAETEEEVAATVVEVGGKKLIVTLAEEVTAPGEYQLNVEGVKKMDGTFAPDMQFDYTIKSGETDTNYYILGDFFGWDNPKQLELTDDGLYVLVIDATVEAQKYEYKLRQGDNWDGYQLPASGNYDFVFGTDEYPAGDYTLTFTANVGSEEISGIPAYTVVLTAVKKEVVEPVSPWENVKITPAARSEVESLQEFELDFSDYASVQTFWGAGIDNPYIVVTGTEEKLAEGTLGDVYDGKIPVTFAEPITEPGSYTLIIPALCIQVDGQDNPELSFLYTIKGEDAPDYTIDPEGVVQESLGVFNITFNNYGIEQYNYDAQATLKNETTGTELKADINVIGTNRVFLSFEETTEPGNYTLTIPAKTLANAMTGSPLDFEISASYRIEGAAAEDYTIDPAPGEVESLQSFTITFNNYMIELDGSENAYLFNAETEEEVAATVVEVGGKKLIVTLAEEVTAPGEYQLNVEGVKKMDGTFAPDMQFDYTIKTGETDTNYYILGDFFGWDNPKQLELTDDGLYVLVIDATVEAQKYEYKLRQGDNWDGYQLPASGNYDFVFGTDEYPAGDYTLTFTANVGSEEINGIPGYTVVLTAVKKGTTTGISVAQRSTLESERMFDLQGRAADSNAKGLVIVQSTDSQGNLVVRKVVRK